MDLTNLNQTLQNQVLPIVQTVAQGYQTVSTIVKSGSSAPKTSGGSTNSGVSPYVPPPAPETKTGITPTQIAIGVGAVALVGGIIYMVVKKK